MRNLKKQGFLWMAVFTLCKWAFRTAVGGPGGIEKCKCHAFGGCGERKRA